MLSNRLPVIATVALLLLTAGCLGAAPFGDDTDDPGAEEDELADADELPDADELLERTIQADSNVETIHGVQTTSIGDGDEVVTTTHEVWMRGSDEFRMELRESDESDEPDVMVSSGTSTWLYDEEANEVITMDLAFEPDELEALDEALTDAFFADTTATVDGTATVADREAYVLELEADGDDAMYDSATIWVDQETYYPLKQESTMSVLGETTDVSVAFESIAFDDDLEDDLFAYDPPADAEVVDVDDLASAQFDDVDEAAALAPFDLPDPEVPAAYELDLVTVSENIAGWSASLQYAADADAVADASLFVNVAEADNDAEIGSGDDIVEIGDTEAVVHEFEYGETTTTTLEWTDGLTYSVGGDLETEALIAVAESIVE